MMVGIDVGEIPTHPHLRNYDKMSTIVINPYLGGGDWWEGAELAYQPKGAASQVSSYTDLTGNGYTLTTTNAPSWNATDGWVSTRESNQFLDTGYIPVPGTDTVLIRFSNATELFANGRFIYGNTALVAPFEGHSIALRDIDWQAKAGASIAIVTPAITGGVVCIAGQDVYLNGVYQQTIGTSTTAYNVTAYLCARNSGALLTPAVYMQAAAIYTTTLSAGQVASISAKMAAL